MLLVHVISELFKVISYLSYAGGALPQASLSAKWSGSRRLKTTSGRAARWEQVIPCHIEETGRSRGSLISRVVEQVFVSCDAPRRYFRFLRVLILMFYCVKCKKRVTAKADDISETDVCELVKYGTESTNQWISNQLIGKN